MPTSTTKPRWHTILSASIFVLLLLIGSVVGYYAGEDKPTVAKAKSTLLAKLERGRVKPVPSTAMVEERTPEPEPIPEAKPKVKPTKAPPLPSPTTRPAEPKPEPKKPEPEPKKPEPPVVMVTFDKVMPIFKAKCNLCHGDPTIKEDLDLRSVAAIKKSPNSRIIIPGNPEDSTLYERIKDGSMPPGKDNKLTPAELQLIRDWIQSGGK